MAVANGGDALDFGLVGASRASGVVVRPKICERCTCTFYQVKQEVECRRCWQAVTKRTILAQSHRAFGDQRKEDSGRATR